MATVLEDLPEGCGDELSLSLFNEFCWMILEVPEKKISFVYFIRWIRATAMPITYVKADVRSNCKMKKKNPLQNENEIGFSSSEVRKLFSFIIIFKILISLFTMFIH